MEQVVSFLEGEPTDCDNVALRSPPSHWGTGMAKRLAGVLLGLASHLMAMQAWAVEDLPSDKLNIEAEFPGGDYFEFGLIFGS